MCGDRGSCGFHRQAASNLNGMCLIHVIIVCRSGMPTHTEKKGERGMRKGSKYGVAWTTSLVKTCTITQYEL